MNQDSTINRYAEFIRVYTHRLDAVAYTAPLVDVVLQAGLAISGERAGIEASELQEQVGAGNPIPVSGYAKFRAFQKWIQNQKQVRTSIELLNESHVVSVCSQLDGLVSNLVRQVISDNTNLINEKELGMKVHEIASYQTTAELVNHIVDMQVERVMRTGHDEQLKWIGESLNMKLGDVPNKQKVQEILQRRHMIVHNNGISNRSYATLRNKLNSKSKLKSGNKISTDAEYVFQSHNIFWVYGAKIALSVWSKARPNDAEAIHGEVTTLSYALIRQGLYNMAIEILVYTVEVLCKFQKPSKEQELTHKINLAQAHKWNNQEEECTGILKAEEWTVLSYRFHISYLALSDQFTNLVELMKKIGKDDDFKLIYEEWPLFRVASTRDDFKETFLEVYGEPFAGRHDDIGGFLELMNMRFELRQRSSQGDLPFTNDETSLT